MTNPSQLVTQHLTADIADLLGPANGPEEIVDERTMRDHYLVGKLGHKGQCQSLIKWFLTVVAIALLLCF